MNIIEKNTGKLMAFLEKITKRAWLKWLSVAVIFLLLIGGVFVVIYFPLVFSTFDMVGIGLFLVVGIYFLIQVQRMK